MYFTALPDHSAPGFDEQAHFDRFSRHNVIFNAYSRESHCENHVGCLSLKTIRSGEEWYQVDGREVAIRRGQFLILNDNQTYSCRIDKGSGAHVLSIFFQKDFAASVFHELSHSAETLLDEPFDNDRTIPEFFQTIHSIQPELATDLSALLTQLDTHGDDPNHTDERLVYLLRSLLWSYRTDRQLLRQVDAVKLSTRMEIYRRLCVAKDMLHSSFQGSVSLAELSKRVCLSRPQLIRQFRIVYGRTPYQYLMEIRLRHAADCLRETRMPVNEITWHCGFSDTSAFCRAFRIAYGLSPEQFRSRNR